VNKTVITYDDPQTANRFCVLTCTQSPNPAFADPSTGTCVPICPSFPPLFGDSNSLKCVSACPSGYYANTNTRTCDSACPTSYFKNTNPNICLTVCPALTNPPLYGDPNTNTCVATCSNNYFRYTTLSLCVASCATYNLLAYDMTCTLYCPAGFYANSSNICVSSCPSSTFG